MFYVCRYFLYLICFLSLNYQIKASQVIRSVYIFLCRCLRFQLKGSTPSRSFRNTRFWFSTSVVIGFLNLKNLSWNGFWLWAISELYYVRFCENQDEYCQNGETTGAGLPGAGWGLQAAWRGWLAFGKRSSGFADFNRVVTGSQYCLGYKCTWSLYFIRLEWLKQ